MMRFELQHVDGLALRTASVRRGGRPTIVLTNAFPQSIRCWASVWDRLAERFDLLAVDLPGFGRSQGVREIMRPSAHADVLAKLMDHLGIERAFVVGPDVGVPVALWMAAKHADRVQGINIFDGPGFWPPDFDRVLRTVTTSGLLRWLATRPPMRGSIMKQNLEVALRGGYHHFEPSAEAAEEYRAVCFDPQAHRHAFDYLGSYHDDLPRLERALPTITVPALITWGAQDTFVPPSNAERLHALLPDSELTIFEDAGHFSHEDADDRWLDRFSAFVDRCLDQRAARPAASNG